LAERLEEPARDGLRAAIELRALGAARRGQADTADPSVPAARLDGDEALALERPEEPAGVAGVEGEARAPLANRRALGAALPGGPGSAEGPAPTEEPVVERADPVGHGPVEASDAPEGGRIHCLTLVRELSGRQAGARPRRQPWSNAQTRSSHAA